MAQLKLTLQFSALVLVSSIVVHETALVQPQAPAQVEVLARTPNPLQVQPLIVAVAQPASQAARTSSTTMKPIAKQITRFDIKQAIEIDIPKSNTTNTPRPKSYMKIVKSADLKPTPSPSKGYTSDKGFFSSLVDVDRSENKSRVGVHIPLIFDMTNNKDEANSKSKLDLTVLSGMVTVNRDREKGKGPLTVTVFGIPVYTGTGNGGPRGFADRLDSSIESQKRRLEEAAGSRKLPEASVGLYSSVKRNGEKGLANIAAHLDKVSSFLKEQATPISNVNGRAAGEGDLFVTKPPQLRLEELKPRLSEAAFKRFANTNTTAHEFHMQTLR